MHRKTMRSKIKNLIFKLKWKLYFKDRWKKDTYKMIEKTFDY